MLLSLKILLIYSTVVCHLSTGIFVQQGDCSTGSLVNTNGSCPPWTYHQSPNSTYCECGSSLDNVVQCKNGCVALVTCHCISYNKELHEVVVGVCPYLCTNKYYLDVPNRVEELDSACQEINRTGQMCGKCREKYAPSVYSYSIECTECSYYKYNWITYILRAYLPLTIFYLVVALLRFNAMSGSLNAFIFTSQIISCPTILSVLTTFVYYSEKNPVIPINLKLISDLFVSFYGVWNLDFFRFVYKPFCLHPNLSSLQAISLDYAIAVYPLLLIFLTYLFVKLYDHFQIFQFVCKPIAWLFTKYNKNSRVGASLIKAFGTFLLLSFVKIANTSVNLLMPVQIYNMSGHVIGLYTYYNGSLPYFGHNHLPYALLAIFMFAIFNLIPLLLLCLYPCRCFQSCLNRYKLNSQVLCIFMDAFQGYFKFEPDYRYFSGFYPFLRIALFLIFGVTGTKYFIMISGIVAIPTTVFVVILRPYKNNITNIIDIVFLLNFVLFTFAASSIPLTSLELKYLPFSYVMFGVTLTFPVIYGIVLAVFSILPMSAIAIKSCIANYVLQVNRDT